jgi:peptide chain release factor subunit 1
LSQEKSNGMSCVSTYIPPNKPISELSSKLNEEYAQANSIKDKTNRNSVLQIITSVREKLKGIQKAPNNGLVIFCGFTGQDRKICLQFEPFRPLSN